MSQLDELPVYDYQQEPHWIAKGWIAQKAYYVSHPDLGSIEQSAYWPYCEQVIYSHVYKQNGNVADRRQRLLITIGFITSSAIQHGRFSVWSEYSFKNTRLVLTSINLKILVDGRSQITYHMYLPLTPDEIESYRPADVQP
ncbi:hypothetical protein [Spirosoma koreense]